MKFLKKMIIAIVIMPIISIASNTINIVMDHSVNKKETFQKIVNIVRSLKVQDRAIIYDAKHNKITSFDIDYIYSKNNWIKKYKEELLLLAKGITKNEKFKINKGDIKRHIEFISELQKEHLRQQSSSKFESIILSSFDDKRLEIVSDKFSELDLDLEALIYNDTPYKVENNEYSDTILHIAYPYDLDTHNARKLCRFWKGYIEKGGGMLGNCRKNVDNKNFFLDNYGSKLDTKKLVTSMDTKLLSKIKWTKNSVEFINDNNKQPINIINNIKLTTATPLEIKKPVSKKPKSRQVKKHNLPITITLSWSGKADLDLSIWSDEGNLNFAERSSFGIFSKETNIETIILNQIPKNASFRVVHSNGNPPKRVRLKFKSNNTEHIENLDGVFKTKTEYRNKEFVYNKPLKDILETTLMSGYMQVKSGY